MIDLAQVADDLLAYGPSMTYDDVLQRLQGVVDLATKPLIAERNRARDISVALEQQLAAVAVLHRPVNLGEGTPNAIPWCNACGAASPCETARALDADYSIDLTEGARA